jgi:D-alanyl-D-alanine endopeptidase (penicillin-binding protein 7)
LNSLALVQWIVHRASTSRMWVRFLHAGPLIVALAVSPAHAKSKFKPTPETAKAVFVYDRTNNTVRESINADSIVPIASITKLMTAYVALESHAPLDEFITIVAQKIETSNVLRPGMRVSRQTLIELSLIASDNLAAKTLALSDPEGYQSFIGRMNSTARQLGMESTNYIEPTGLLPNTSTARDLHLLNRALVKYSAFTDSAMSKTSTVIVKDKRGLWQKLNIRNTNFFAGSYDIKIGKTGFTSPAGWCINMLIHYNNQEFDIVVLGSPSKDVRNRLVAEKLKEHMNYITTKSVMQKIDKFDEVTELEFFSK